MSANVLRQTLRNWYDRAVSGSQNSKWSPDDLLISSRYSKASHVKKKSMMKKSVGYGEMPSLHDLIERYDFWVKHLVRMKNIVAQKSDFWALAWDVDETEEQLDAINFIKAFCRMQLIRRKLISYRESLMTLEIFFLRSCINRKFVGEQTRMLKNAATLIQKRIRGILGRQKAEELGMKMRAMLDSILLKKESMAIGQKVIISPHLFYPCHKLNKSKGKIMRKEFRQGTIVKILGDRCRIFFDHVISEIKFGEYKYSHLLLLKDIPRLQDDPRAEVLSPRLLVAEIVNGIVENACREIGYSRRGRYTYRPRKKADVSSLRPTSWYGSNRSSQPHADGFKTPYMTRRETNGRVLSSQSRSLPLPLLSRRDSLFLSSRSATLHPSPRVREETTVLRYSNHLQQRY
ncbi:hypothetical protein GUITHDRAFT_137375 [Guillardia theta CCMP2712]|uniref:Uncharacterized protein n=1 Tax=Guillardia theta (strain CCMP2712) TaxID=905079 RepID=L1JHI2_GUITC|nr:hypothetical protein GUITHDRAFT_137375 [Guillardia theta CCMP2712]EKX47604.1 hypothetical protein GUITHDRAFT_137375 [Guillardia theta CCMP2712]|eukprot:XP_005834584.1 hypothetical protein GUITHDRAFT_137375 [Guillardia theta CCMP2712]